MSIEIRELRRTIAQLVAQNDWSRVPIFSAVRIIAVPAGGAEASEIAPNRPDRLRLRVQVRSGGPVEIAETPEVAVLQAGWQLTLGGPPFVDDPPVAARGTWYAWASVASVVAVIETIRLPASSR